MATSPASLSPRASRVPSASSVSSYRPARVAPAPVLSSTGIPRDRSPSGTSVAAVAVQQPPAYAPRVTAPLDQAVVHRRDLEGTAAPSRAVQQAPPEVVVGPDDDGHILAWLTQLCLEGAPIAPAPPPHQEYSYPPCPVRTLDELQAKLNQVDAQQRQLSLLRPQYSASRAVEYDLQGACLTFLTPGSSLIIPSRIALFLINGSLDLKDQGVIYVQQDAQLELESVNVRGSGVAEMGLVTISGSEALGELRHCDISVTNPPSAGDFRRHAVYVLDDGTARLHGCTLSSVTGYGLYVEGCEARATDCSAENCGLAGFAVAGIARPYLSLTNCTADSNSGSGFSARGPNAVLECHGKCISSNNHKAGFRAAAGAQLNSTGVTVAGCNGLSGFVAHGNSSFLAVGSHSQSNYNRGHGFLAQRGGQVMVGSECIAAGNGRSGFASRGEESHMRIGAECTAVHNAGGGVYDVGGGALLYGDVRLG